MIALAKTAGRDENKELRERRDFLGLRGAAEESAARFLPSVRVELLSNKEAVVDGCRGIIEYSDCCIRLSTDKQILKFTGRGLVIRCFQERGAVVAGYIQCVEFC